MASAPTGPIGHLLTSNIRSFLSPARVLERLVADVLDLEHLERRRVRELRQDRRISVDERALRDIEIGERRRTLLDRRQPFAGDVRPADAEVGQVGFVSPLSCLKPSS